MILEETYSFLREKYKDLFENLTISDVRLGIHLTAVKLSDESYGAASTLSYNQLHCCKENRDFGDFTPNRIKGQRVFDLFSSTKKTDVIDTLKMAVINAISSRILQSNNYKIIENADPIDLLDLSSNKTITIVGAFPSYIRKIEVTQNNLYVLELNENAFIDGQKKYYVPASEYSRIIPISDIVIITGLTLVNNTIDGLLSSISPTTKTIVTGPSSSIIPDILFKNKVNMIGATRITDPELLFTVASEAGAGYHLFKYGAQKICILNE
ncbi:MAG: hypothetical protein EHM93_16385 [Bacteroidales bacterium]|nr:MAG: hypothetical protein EHM93_16385 [Bacteroidales bacterium]